MSKYGWSADEAGQVFICSQEESIKPKNIVEKIDFDSEWPGRRRWGGMVSSSESSAGCARPWAGPSFRAGTCLPGSIDPPRVLASGGSVRDAG